MRIAHGTIRGTISAAISGARIAHGTIRGTISAAISAAISASARATVEWSWQRSDGRLA
jgi:hypothetical protein